MNFLRKIAKYESKIEGLFRRQKNQKLQNNVSIVESDALGMTVIDDQEDDQNLEEIQALSVEEWVQVFENGSLSGFSFSRIYFSFLKGIPTFLRYKIWLFFSTENSLKNFKISAKINAEDIIEEFRVKQEKQENQERQEKQKKQSGQNYIRIDSLTNEMYLFLSRIQPLQMQKIQIDKDVHRSYSTKKEYIYTSQLLRKILYSLSNSGIEYSQGMNYILLNVIIFTLESLGITNQQLFNSVNVEIERNIFLIIREIVVRMDTVFGNNNIFKVVAELEEKIAETVPEVLYLIYKLGMDCFGMFSQHYFALLSYNESTPQLNKVMMDLFFVAGEKAIHAIIVKILQVSKEKILVSRSAEQLNHILKKQLFLEYAQHFQRQQKEAKKLSDFGLSFYENRSLRN